MNKRAQKAQGFAAVATSRKKSGIVRHNLQREHDSQNEQSILHQQPNTNLRSTAINSSQLHQTKGCFTESLAFTSDQPGKSKTSEKLKQTLLADKDQVDILESKATAHLRQGDIDSAIYLLQQCLELRPKNTISLYNMGLALQQKGKISAAIFYYKKALYLDSNNPQILNNLGLAMTAAGEWESALSLFDQAIDHHPAFISSYINAGALLEDQEDYIGSISYYEKGIELSPENRKLNYNLGVSQQKAGELREAIKTYQVALGIDPKQAKIFQNMGTIYQELGEIELSISHLKHALQLLPGDPSIHKNLGMAQLLKGDYLNGLINYEHRLRCDNDKASIIASPMCPQWTGDLSMIKEPLLLVSEQGLGDTFQFMRYALHLKKKGISTRFCAPAKLHDLIKASGIDAHPLHPEQAESISAGQWVPLLSVPLHLGISPENPGLNHPYIKTESALEQKWKNILPTQEKPIIGINWQGNPKHEKSITRGRSMPLANFAALPEICDCSLVSLQKGYGSEQLEDCTFRDSFVDVQGLVNETWDFLETAAIIQSCDLIITTDTSVAHLSAGQGQTTWLLLQYIPEWRWGLQGETTFWYPTMRIFRQHHPGDWDSLIKTVANQAKKLLNSSEKQKKLYS